MRMFPLRWRLAVVGLVLATAWVFAAEPAETATPTPTVAVTPATPIPCGEAAPPLCAGGDCGGGISSCQPDPSGFFCLCEPPTPSPAEPTPTASPRLDRPEGVPVSDKLHSVNRNPESVF